MKTPAFFCMKNSCLIFILCLVLTSCVKEVTTDPFQNRIFSIYELSYDRNAGKTMVMATFRVGSDTGRTLKLSSASEVKFANEAIPFEPGRNDYYREFSRTITVGTFFYRDSIKNVYSNNINLIARIENPVVNTINRAQGSFELDWLGDSIIADSYVMVTLKSLADTSKKEVFYQRSLGAGSLIMGLDKLNRLPAGPAIIRTERYFEKKATSASPAGGLIRSRYIAPDRSISLL